MQTTFCRAQHPSPPRPRIHPKSDEYSLPSASAGHVKVFIRHILDVEKRVRKGLGEEDEERVRERRERERVLP